jgi:hypothetical protein
MTTFPVPTNPTDTYILRIDILEEGGSFNTSDSDHNAALILEDSNKHKYGIEYVSIEEFESYIKSFNSFDKDIYETLKEGSKDFDEDSIEFSITDYETLQHFEDFRISEFNNSGSIHPYND